MSICKSWLVEHKVISVHLERILHCILIEEVRTNRPIPAEVKNELKDINDSSIQFDPDGDLND